MIVKQSYLMRKQILMLIPKNNEKIENMNPLINSLMQN